MDNFLHNTTEWLTRYMDGELDNNEKLQVEKELASNPALRAELDKLLVAKKSIRLFGLKQQVTGIHNEMMNEIKNSKTELASKATVRQMIRYSLAIAASLLVLFVGVKTYNYYTVSADSLFKEKYAAYDLGSLRGGETKYTDIEQAYRNKNYRQVILLSKTSDSATIKELFLEGVSFLELGENDQAIKKFSEIPTVTKDNTGSLFKDAAEYYLSLSYLKNKDYDKALNIMRHIQADPQHLYHPKITESFIRKIERLK